MPLSQLVCSDVLTLFATVASHDISLVAVSLEEVFRTKKFRVRRFSTRQEKALVFLCIFSCPFMIAMRLAMAVSDFLQDYPWGVLLLIPILVIVWGIRSFQAWCREDDLRQARRNRR